MWPAKIPFLFGACAGGSLILLVSATLVGAKFPPWISSVEGRWVPTHRSESFHRAALAEAICRWRWSLVTKTSVEEAEGKTKNKQQLKAIWSRFESCQDPTITVHLAIKPPPYQNQPQIPQTGLIGLWLQLSIVGQSLFPHIAWSQANWKTAYVISTVPPCCGAHEKCSLAKEFHVSTIFPHPNWM